MLLCLCMTAVAETVNIDGVYYQLHDGWTAYYYDSNGNYQSGEYFEHAAFVTYDPSIDPYSVQVIDTYEGDLAIPEKVTYQGVEYTVTGVSRYAFMRNKSLTSVQLPSSVKLIENYSFRECTSLTSVTMPGVVYISATPFSGCNLKTIQFPKTLKSLNKDFFSNSPELTSITVEEGNEVYCSEDGVMYNKAKTEIIGYPVKKGGIYKIPSTITTVSANSFPSNVDIDELIIPATVTKLDNNAFGYSPQIKKLTIEDSDKELTIGAGANNTGLTDEKGNYREIYPMFINALQELYWGRPLKYSSAYNAPFANSTLNKVVIGEKVTSIPKYSFYNCYNMNTVDVRGGFDQWIKFDFSEPYSSPFSGRYTEDGQQDPTVTFNGTELSGAVVIPDGVTNIPAHALQYGCTGVTSITIPAEVATIADGAFKELKQLTEVKLASGNTSFVLDDNVLYNKEKTKILLFPQLRAGDYTMPSTITEMGDYQFYNCTQLTGINLSSNLKSIGEYAFYGCTQLANVTIPASEEIKTNAFNGCTLLETVTLPNDLKTIGLNAFANCNSLSSIVIPASVETIQENAFGNCTALQKVVLEDGDAPLNLLGATRDKSYYWDSNYKGTWEDSPIDTVYIGRNITLSDENYYSYFGSKLYRINIGSKVTSFPKNIFYGCGNVKEVYFDGTIIDWCNITFANEYATPFGNAFVTGNVSPILYLKGSPLHSQVDIPEPATKIGAYAFYGQRGVSTIIVPATVKTIEPFAFQNDNISDVYINATDIISLADANSFSGNTNIWVFTGMT